MRPDRHRLSDRRSASNQMATAGCPGCLGDPVSAPANRIAVTRKIAKLPLGRSLLRVAIDGLAVAWHSYAPAKSSAGSPAPSFIPATNAYADGRIESAKRGVVPELLVGPGGEDPRCRRNWPALRHHAVADCSTCQATRADRAGGHGARGSEVDGPLDQGKPASRRTDG